jgi:hypothetical protein
MALYSQERLLHGLIVFLTTQYLQHPQTRRAPMPLRERHSSTHPLSTSILQTTLWWYWLQYSGRQTLHRGDSPRQRHPQLKNTTQCQVKSASPCVTTPPTPYFLVFSEKFCLYFKKNAF